MKFQRNTGFSPFSKRDFFIYHGILLQFLAEAILISITGKLIGIGLDITASRLINIFLKWPTLVSESSIVLSFWVCAVTGIFSGYYPALKAARLDPMEALHYE